MQIINNLSVIKAELDILNEIQALKERSAYRNYTEYCKSCGEIAYFAVFSACKYNHKRKRFVKKTRGLVIKKYCLNKGCIQFHKQWDYEHYQGLHQMPKRI